MGKDLGTYYLRVELQDGRGWIHQWLTGRRYTEGTPEISPLTAMVIPPSWNDECELFEAMDYLYREGNYSCDCNKWIFLARATHSEEPEDPPCGETLLLQRLTAIRPDGTESILYEAATGRPLTLEEPGA